MKEPDWVVHNVLGKPITFHTYGLDKYDSLEIEVALPLYPEEGALFCNCIGVAIAEGLKIEDGLMVENLFINKLGCWLPIYFFKTKAIYGDKEVFRAIFPDPNELFPWEQLNGVMCADEYKDQIRFTEDMCFYIVVEDTEIVERYGTDFGSTFYTFEKRGNQYIRPAHYYIADLRELMMVSPYINGGDVFELRRFMRNLKGVYKVKNSKVVCKPIDYTDPLHKSFKEFIWKYKDQSLK